MYICLLYSVFLDPSWFVNSSCVYIFTLGYTLPASENKAGAEKFMGRLLSLLPSPEGLHNGCQSHLRV